MLHIKIHQLYQKKFKIAQIAKELKISRPTVYKYLNMTFEEVKSHSEELSQSRVKKLDPYKDWIVAWLEEFPHLSSAQIHDWLLERYPELLVGGSTVRTYVREIREVNQIDKKRKVRQYEAIPEQPMGKQLQVDWGETKQRTKSNKEIKLYFIAFVLAHSRMKYMEWQNRPFTTRDAIRCHENAFQFYGGRTTEIVYDQDHLIAVSENAGELLLTSEFQQYVQQRKFNVHLCRRADPESKGMIENVVKYIKGNFADSRVYSNIEDWNRRASQWLARTGNHNVHQTTKKRPAEVFSFEKQHLQPVHSLLSYESTHVSSIARNVSKDNTIRYRSNRYSVPLGTYSSYAANTVFIELTDANRLLIRTQPEGKVIADHPVSSERGKLIQSRHHLRDRSHGIDELKQHLTGHFTDEEKATHYLEELCKKFPRYKREQLAIIENVIHDYGPQLDQSLEKCTQEKLYSANDFRDVARYLSSNTSPIAESRVHSIGKHVSDIQVNTRPLSTYVSILRGGV